MAKVKVPFKNVPRGEKVSFASTELVKICFNRAIDKLNQEWYFRPSDMVEVEIQD